MLSDMEVARYREDGFIHLRGVFTPAEVEELRAACEAANVKQDLHARGYEDKLVHLHQLTLKHPAFRALALDARIVEPVAVLAGPSLQLQQSKLATKPPKVGKGEFQWHQDFAFFPHTNTDLAAVFVMLDDCTLENGCLHVVRGSHKLGLLDHTGSDGMFSGACRGIERHASPENVVALQGRAGDITIHHALTLHASFNNQSGRERRGVILQYRAADAYQLDGWVFEDTGWQVRGTYPGHTRCSGGTIRCFPRDYSGSTAADSARHQTGPAAKAWNVEPVAGAVLTMS